LLMSKPIKQIEPNFLIVVPERFLMATTLSKSEHSSVMLTEWSITGILLCRFKTMRLAAGHKD
jgi:hypothetical protein